MRFSVGANASRDGPGCGHEREGRVCGVCSREPGCSADADIKSELILARLQVTRGGVTKFTTDDFMFFADAKTKGRVWEGQLLPRDLKLSWVDLKI